MCIFSPDDTTVFTAIGGDTNIWSATTGACLIRLDTPKYPSVESAAFSPDGTMVVIAQSVSATIWCPATGAVLLTLRGHRFCLGCVLFSPDGTLILTASWYEPARIWSVTKGTCLRMLSPHHDGVGEAMEASFSFDGRFVLTWALDTTVRIWNTDSGICEMSLSVHREDEDCPPALHCTASFSPDGTSVLTACTLMSCESAVKIWNATTGECLRVFSFNELCYPHRCICSFSFDGRSVIIAPRIARDTDGPRTYYKAKVWNIATGEAMVTLSEHKGTVTSIAEAPIRAARPVESRVHTISRRPNDAEGGRVKRIRR